MTNAPTLEPTDRIAVDADTILDTLARAVVMTDADGIITAWNPGASELLGWDASDMIGQSVVTLAQP